MNKPRRVLSAERIADARATLDAAFRAGLEHKDEVNDFDPWKLADARKELDTLAEILQRRVGE